ncbi:uncharacterized protein LOC126791430 isoform X2 [Argentina anserina]|uniref:uncharacterized protein LOC126791430 isoform X2 n=1 Tax=Argentina anserina TaxID=57926 RepID=UPI002176202D|nr:uncharacterized protein LOC126791430 isoform X2 [Potentilla anserina]
MASSRKWATTISFIASSIYFTVIIIQIPLFSVPCISGTCTSPVAVTAPQLLACDLIPTVAIKALVYPGAVAKALVKNEAIPSFSNLKLHDPSAVTAADAIADLQRLEGFEVVLPDKATMEHTVIPAIEALNRKDIEGSQNLLRIALQVLLVRAVNSVILASDEMRDLLPQDDSLLIKCIDPMDALASSTIKLATSAAKVWYFRSQIGREH